MQIVTDGDDDDSTEIKKRDTQPKTRRFNVNQNGNVKKISLYELAAKVIARLTRKQLYFVILAWIAAGTLEKIIRILKETQ